VVCALSGGPDSSALVALAAAAGLQVEAVHVHHGLRSSADDDAAAAKRIALQLGARFRCEHADLDDGPNLEARARLARRRLIGVGAITGHTADDQAETLLLALLRGSGATGLAAIEPGPTHPMLRLRRHETQALCDELGLDPVTDPTNSDLRFRRNRIRSELLPLMHTIAERDVTTLLNRTSDLLRDDDDLLDELSLALDPTDARAISAAPLPLARRTIRRLLSVDGYPPDAASIARVLAVAAGETSACEVTGVGRVERSQQRLRIVRSENDAPNGDF
jgi:tRNA(Ile)-lysidine synthase